MLIDWFTVGAQTVNFLVLVWLLKRFLYRPILSAIDKREQRIAEQLADADARQQDARQERDEYSRKNQALDRQREQLLNDATRDAKAERDRMLEDARREADDLRHRRRESLRRELNHLQNEITRRTQAEVFAIARRVLDDLADVDLEARICQVFLQRLAELNDDVKDKVRASRPSPESPAVLRSAGELSAEQRDAIQRTVQEVFAMDLPIRFSTDPDVAGGMELTVGGQRIAWSIGDYLNTLQDQLNELLDEPSTDSPLGKARVAG